MKGATVVFNTNLPFRWMDSGVYRDSPLKPLIYDEALAAAMSLPNPLPVIHLWVYDKALFLGRRDARLPRLESTLRRFGEQGHGCVLRSSGGACVPLDAGVLNLACLLPDTSISIDAFFRLVSDLLRVGLKEFGEIAFGEVTGSYCVGDYDFAIRGKKIGGMAQRRTRHGSILQLCINVEESPRGHLMESFYRQAGLAEMEKNKPIPFIDGTTIGSIAGLTGRDITVPEVKQRLLAAIRQEWKVTVEPFSVPALLVDEAEQHLVKRLGLYAFQAEELQSPDWRLPE
jgi:octanoyl-[GcvH]:protein N-octanoyltransferase